MATRLFTVKLTDEERGELDRRATAAGTPASQVIKAWLRAGVTAEARAAFKESEVAAVRPAFLFAPDDDCVSCGHDRQAYHMGVCTCPTGPKSRCGCMAFVSAAEPF